LKYAFPEKSAIFVSNNPVRIKKVEEKMMINSCIYSETYIYAIENPKPFVSNIPISISPKK
jgi:hypothetical protein